MNNESILVVDDDDDVRAALLDELSSRYAVTSAASGEEAFALLSARRFDAVISDLRMPDHDGIEVLDFAASQQEGIVRILLTGYLDERAHAALLKPDAPFKVGKPWHDEVEVVLERAFEQRKRTRILSASLKTAYTLHQIDASVASAASLRELGEVLVLRAATITGVIECGAVLDGETVAGSPPDDEGAGWRMTLPVDDDGRLCVTASGSDLEARELLAHLVHIAQRHAGVHRGSGEAIDASRPCRSRIDELLRQATVGAMAGALIHDIAGILQGVEGAMLQLAALAAERDDAELIALANDMEAANHDAIGTFVAMRRFIREGTASLRVVHAADLIKRACSQAGGAVRERATLRIGEIPPLSVHASDALAVQVLVAVLKNAAEVSPAGKRGVVDIEVLEQGERVAFVITDDGPGVPDHVAVAMFEPHLWQRPTGVGAGLAIANFALRVQRGSISYRRAPGRGACFTITLLRASAD